MKTNSNEENLITLIRDSEPEGPYYCKQEDIARELKITQSGVSKLIRKAEKHGKIQRINNQYRLSDIASKLKTTDQLSTLLTELPCKYTRVSNTSFALELNPFKHKTMEDLLQQFFGELHFGSFSADKLLIVLLQSGRQEEVKTLLLEFKKIMNEKNENNSQEP